METNIRSGIALFLHVANEYFGNYVKMCCALFGIPHSDSGLVSAAKEENGDPHLSVSKVSNKINPPLCVEV